MISEPTVLILGAGASMPFGFPSGNQLVQRVCALCQEIRFNSNRELLQAFAVCGFDSDNVFEFGEALAKSGQVSVDAFLEHRTEYIEVGKAAIAAALLPFEKESVLFNSSKNWYQHLFLQLNTSFEKFDQNRIAVITFNYDRSFEHYLFTALKYKYGKSNELSAEKFRVFSIIHVHGSLGRYEWQTGHSIPVPFGKGTLLDNFDNARKQIKIIHEDIQNDLEFQKAHQCLAAAKKVYFLGFGYHPMNLERLRICSLKNIEEVGHVHMQGTSVGLSLQQRTFIQTIREPVNGQRIQLQDCDVYDFLHDKVVFA
jgi:hypothetical protein